MAKQLTVGAQQAVVHAPGVDANAVKICPAGTGGGAQRLDDMRPESQNIPTKGAVDGYWAIRETMDLVNAKKAPLHSPYHGPTTARAEVEGKKNPLFCSHFPMVGEIVSIQRATGSHPGFVDFHQDGAGQA